MNQLLADTRCLLDPLEVTWKRNAARGVREPYLVVMTAFGRTVFKNIDCRRTTPDKLLAWANQFTERLWKGAA